MKGHFGDLLFFMPYLRTMYAQLGSIIFQGLIGFRSLDHQAEANLVELPLIDGKPLLQKVGDNLDKISFDVLFHVAFCDPEAQISALDNARRNGNVLPFILGNGRNLGDFVVRSTNTSQKQTDANGNIREATVSVELVEYVQPDSVMAALTSAISSGFANVQNLPSVISGAAPLPANALTGTNPNPAVAASALVVATSAGAQGVNNALRRVQLFPAQASYQMAVISSRTQGMARDISALQGILENPGSVQDVTEDLALHLPSLLSTVNLVNTYAGAGNLSLVQDTNTTLQSSVDLMRTYSSGLAALKSIR